MHQFRHNRVNIRFQRFFLISLPGCNMVTLSSPVRAPLNSGLKVYLLHKVDVMVSACLSSLTFTLVMCSLEWVKLEAVDVTQVMIVNNVENRRIPLTERRTVRPLENVASHHCAPRLYLTHWICKLWPPAKMVDARRCCVQFVPVPESWTVGKESAMLCSVEAYLQPSARANEQVALCLPFSMCKWRLYRIHNHWIATQ